MLRFYDFINESKIDNTFGADIKKSLLLFSDTIRKDYDKNGNRFPLFYPYYENIDIFYGLSLVNPKGTEVDSLRGKFRDCRFTQLGKTTYKDTVENGRRKLTYDEVANIVRNKNDYYFYHFVTGKRDDIEAPDRERIEDFVKHDDKEWYFVIERGINCSLVKTVSRQEGGYWAEHQLSSIHDWTNDQHNIKMKIRKNDELIRVNGLIKNIMQSNDDDVFSVEDDPLTFVKYDLIIDEGLETQKKIEVKKYDNKENDILNKDGSSKKIMLAEQCKVADRGTLKKIIEWYDEIFPGVETRRLLNMEERDIHKEFSIKFKVDGIWIYNEIESEIADDIRDYYNDKIEKLLNIFNNINKDRWMKGIYGIYFIGPNRKDRREDFLIKIDHNVSYKWEIVGDWLGFKRLKLFMKIDKNAWEYVLVDGNNFEKTFQLKDITGREKLRENGIIKTPRIIYKYNTVKHLWDKEPN